MTRPSELVDHEALERRLSSVRRQRDRQRDDGGWETLSEPSCRKRKGALADDLDAHDGAWWDDLEEFARATRANHKGHRVHTRRNR